VANVPILPLSNDCFTLYLNVSLLEDRVGTQEVLIMLIS
jgi:hypothetical protein